jgi:hypothetical protein
MIPYIFIFDIDGTLIGDITPQVMIYDILQDIRKHNTKDKLKVEDIHYKLKNGILRPHFKNFVDEIKKHYSPVEFFIYTASQKKWADQLIKNIEKALDIKFNRPIFSRNDCMYINGEIRKSISRIKGKIYNSLKKKYENLQIGNLTDKIMMIDNSHVFQPNDTNIVFCPTYTFKYPENIPNIITRNIYEKYFKVIYENINKYRLSIPFTSSYLKFQKYYYQTYIRELFNMSKTEDKFWLILKDILINKNIKSFDENTIKYINNKLAR